MDAKTTSPNGGIEEDVYIEQPKGFDNFERDSHVSDSSECCMDSSKHLVLGIPRSIVISPVRASPKLKRMQTVITLW